MQGLVLRLIVMEYDSHWKKVGWVQMLDGMWHDSAYEKFYIDYLISTTDYGLNT